MRLRRRDSISRVAVGLPNIGLNAAWIARPAKCGFSEERTASDGSSRTAWLRKTPLRLDYSTAIDNSYSTAVSTPMPHAVLETSIFSRRADALLSAEDRVDLIDTLARDPMAGDVMPGLGGVRKPRFAPKGRGKSGAFRVIYYVLTEHQPILALLIFGKNEQSDLSAAQRKVVAALAAEMKRGTGS